MSLCQVFVNDRWWLRRYREFAATGNFKSVPTFSTFCVKGNAGLGNGFTLGEATRPYAQTPYVHVRAN